MATLTLEQNIEIPIPKYFLIEFTTVDEDRYGLQYLPIPKYTTYYSPGLYFFSLQ